MTVHRLIFVIRLLNLAILFEVWYGWTVPNPTNTHSSNWIRLKAFCGILSQDFPIRAAGLSFDQIISTVGVRGK